MNSSGITTIVPTYFESGLPLERFVKCLTSLDAQLVKPDIVIITDDSKDETLRNQYLRVLMDFSLNFSCIRNNEKRGMGSNSNNGLANVKTEYVHILHSDDLLNSNTAYQVMLETIKTNNQRWVFAAGEIGGKIVIPALDDLLLVGQNSLGGPSGLFSKSEIYLRYDPNLKMMVDVEHYFRMIQSFGPPCIIEEPLISYGVGNWQVQRGISDGDVRREIQYLLSKSNTYLEHIKRADKSKLDPLFQIRLQKDLRTIREQGSIRTLVTISILGVKRLLASFVRKLRGTK